MIRNLSRKRECSLRKPRIRQRKTYTGRIRKKISKTRQRRRVEGKMEYTGGLDINDGFGWMNPYGREEDEWTCHFCGIHHKGDTPKDYRGSDVCERCFEKIGECNGSEFEALLDEYELLRPLAMREASWINCPKCGHWRPPNGKCGAGEPGGCGTGRTVFPSPLFRRFHKVYVKLWDQATKKGRYLPGMYDVHSPHLGVYCDWFFVDVNNVPEEKKAAVIKEKTAAYNHQY